MIKNAALQKDVQDAFKRKPLLHTADIAVSAKDGVIFLTGVVDCYVKKSEAGHTAKKVIGVKALVEKIIVEFPGSWSKSNMEIANDALAALKSDWSVPKDKITVKVEDGWVTLEGELPSSYQIESAKIAVKYLTGVKGVTNNINIKSETHDDIERKDVKNAISKNRMVDDSNIFVSVSGRAVTLTGTVSSWFQRYKAGRIAWKTPGIWQVKNELAVIYGLALID